MLLDQEKFEDTTGVITRRKEGQTIQWSSEKGQTLIYKTLRRKRQIEIKSGIGMFNALNCLHAKNRRRGKTKPKTVPCFAEMYFTYTPVLICCRVRVVQTYVFCVLFYERFVLRLFHLAIVLSVLHRV